MFHQHFNTSPDPARYLAIAMGSLRYPMMAEKKRVWLGMDVSLTDGGNQVEYENQHDDVHKIYLESLLKTGAKSKMSKFVPEDAYAADDKYKPAIEGA
jgi:hypothetical protein